VLRTKESRLGPRRWTVSDAVDVKLILERFPYGVFVVATTSPEGAVLGIMATWVTQVSFEPPLIAFAVETGGDFGQALARAGRFSLNLLRSGDLRLATEILKSGPLLEENGAGKEFVLSTEDSPVLRQSAGALLCRITQTREAGDHQLIVAEVTGGFDAQGTEAMTLRETGWKYRRKNSKNP